ncbi:MAG: hypothetical protein A2086_13425 [Spirochaetes bacterium GWD1_27_9]|nr:MAG: hypothetical protein A2086_13425 [Spirochaetes bacterium GWD1_27_9]
MNNIVRIDSINAVHEWAGYGKPEHPLITVIDFTKVKNTNKLKGQTFTLELYLISMKKMPDKEALFHGRKYCDFKDGTLCFMSPGHIITIDEEENTPEQGWGLYFHPNLIQRTNLNKQITNYSFFSYNIYEALHVSDKEKSILNSIVEKIKDEYSSHIDQHSQTLIISNLELLLNYCDRFYTRQFLTRFNSNHDVVKKFNQFLNEYFNSDKIKTQGLPSVKECAYYMNYSTNYLSDLLKKETGKTTLEHIHYYVIDIAKSMLLSSNKTVQEISYDLGFEYTNQFSRLFKKETRMSPIKYRNTS